ncbi:MAG: GtrA family protein [Anaerolineaceae bacterium]|nr:GtrA family protein [Anaerolineaceae bacterium]
MFIFFRYSISSLSSAVLDYGVFLAAYSLGINLFFSTYIARGVSVLYNYFVSRKLVFKSNKGTTKTFPAYIVLVMVSGFFVVLLTKFINNTFFIPIVIAKILCEGLIFFGNFIIQRIFIFSDNE